LASVGIHVWRSADDTVVSGNTFNGSNADSAAVAIKVVGERKAPLAGSDNDAKQYQTHALLENNTISGYGIGVLLGQADTVDREVIATVGGSSSNASNTIKNCGKAVLVDGAFATVEIANNLTSFFDNTIGVEVSNEATVDLDDNKIYRNDTGIKITSGGKVDIDATDFAGADFNTDDIDIASDAGIVRIGETTANKFHAYRQYIINTSSHHIDMTHNKIALVHLSTLSVTNNTQRDKLWTLENKLTHKINDNAYGFLRVKDGHVFVTRDKADDEHAAVGAIERGVNAAENGDLVSVQSSQVRDES